MDFASAVYLWLHEHLNAAQFFCGAVWKNEMWWDCKVDANTFRSFIFSIDKNKFESKIDFDVSVDGDGHDVMFVLYTYEDFQKLTKWMRNKIKLKRDSNGQIVCDKDGVSVWVRIPKPKIKTIFEVKTNILKRAVSLSPGKYALLLDNTHSTITGKNLDLHVVETWGKENAKDLPIVQYFSSSLPADVVTCINDANDCYVAGHYSQCSVMLRKGVELAIKIKLLQSGLSSEQLLDEARNEIGLSAKIKLLKSKKLLTSKSSSSIEDIKWFGDIGAHKTMKITEEDIKNNIEPKIRNLFIELGLKT